MGGLRTLVAVTAVAGALLAGCTSATPHRGHSRPSVSRVPVTAPLVAGKFAANSIAYPSSSTAVIGIAGYPDNSTSPAGWLELSRDAGRHWTIAPATAGAALAASQTGMAFTSAEDGWAYRPNLVFTTDAGVSWQPAPAAPALVGPLAVVGNSAWVVGYPCSRGNCPARLYRADRVGAPLTVLPNQPPATASIDQLLRADDRNAVALISDQRGHQQLSTTVDGGNSWTTHPLPCAAEAAGTRAEISAAGGGALWLLCPEMTRSCASSRYQQNVVYRSADHGTRWARTTPPRPSCQSPMTLYPVSDAVAWATVSTQGPGSVLRTTDGGHTWRRVLVGTDNDNLGIEAVTTSCGRGFSFVHFGIRHGGDIFTVYRTVDGGRTWHTTPLPAPADLAEH
jgi:photosystem II stability/assembly factor-like uncharacterized protein